MICCYIIINVDDQPNQQCIALSVHIIAKIKLMVHRKLFQWRFRKKRCLVSVVFLQICVHNKCYNWFSSCHFKQPTYLIKQTQFDMRFPSMPQVQVTTNKLRHRPAAGGGFTTIMKIEHCGNCFDNDKLYRLMLLILCVGKSCLSLTSTKALSVAGILEIHKLHHWQREYGDTHVMLSLSFCDVITEGYN